MVSRILVTRRLPIDIEELAGDLSVEVFEHDRAPTPHELLSRARGAEAVVSLLSDRFDAEVMDAIGSLKIIANCAVGVDNIDLDAARKRGIRVTNTPDVLTAATADLTWALILAAARRLHEAGTLMRSGGFGGWSPTMLLGQGLDSKRLGLFGFGRIGQAVGRRGAAFEMEITYHARSDKGVDWARWVDKEELLSESDVIAICAPLNDETHHAFGEAELEKMKRSAVLVNIGRGPIIDEAALARALKTEAIFAAGLDVFEREPEVHPELLSSERAVLLPHIGSATFEARRAMASMAIRSAVDVLAGREPENAVV